MADRTDRHHDLIVFGATSFVGEILTRHLVDRHGSTGPLRWAIAGRNPSKLAEVAERTSAAVDQIVVDAASADDMALLAAQTRVVVSTVGPYATYGSELVAAAAAAGTDYCDLTGEPHWMRRMIDAHGSTATESGARIVHACGFDSIPSDLGVWFLQQAAIERFGRPLHRIAMRVRSMKGGPSGGTLASMHNVMDELRSDPSLRKVLTNPYSLAPDGMRSGVRQPDVRVPARDDLFDEWVAPFVMASVNTKVVHRTNALLDHVYGADFAYDEATLMGSGPAGALKAGGLTAGLGGFMAASAVRPVRDLLTGRVLPAPGEGPTPEEQLAGRFDIRFRGRTAEGQGLAARVTGDRDPGYGSTAKMLGEAALLLTEDERRGQGSGGFHTPATAFGDALIEALQEHAGLTFDIDPTFE
jgi:short subunit dehydrogenase-like uncharacterized protein